MLSLLRVWLYRERRARGRWSFPFAGRSAALHWWSGWWDLLRLRAGKYKLWSTQSKLCTTRQKVTKGGAKANDCIANTHTHSLILKNMQDVLGQIRPWWWHGGVAYIGMAVTSSFTASEATYAQEKGTKEERLNPDSANCDRCTKISDYRVKNHAHVSTIFSLSFCFQNSHTSAFHITAESLVEESIKAVSLFLSFFLFKNPTQPSFSFIPNCDCF